MTNNLYDLGRQKLLEGSIDWLTDDIKVILVDTDDYSVDLVTHEFLDDVTSAGIVATSENIGDKDSTIGIADAGDVTFPLVTGDTFEALIIYKDTGDASTSPLIAYIDEAGGFPVTPNGGDIVIQWDNEINKIFKI